MQCSIVKLHRRTRIIMQNKMDNSKKSDHQSDKDANASHQSEKTKPKAKLTEIGGPKGPEPTRYGDWEKKGRCIDF